MPIDPAKPFDLTFTVTPTYREWRLDLFVKAMVPSMSRTKIQKYCAAEKIFVNGMARVANWIVQLNDKVLLSCRPPTDNVQAVAQEIADDLVIIYEDDDLLAINKAAGLVVHPVGKHRHDTLLNALYLRYKNTLPHEQEVSLCNRLDQFTSGIILVAKHTDAKRILQEQFEFRRVKKEYLALCVGVISDDHGVIDLPLGPAEIGKNLLQAVRHDEYGKPAQTRWEVQQRFAPPNNHRGFTLLKLQPHTGRQHQLRVHLAHYGYPLLCDQHYGSAQILRLVSPEKRTVEISRYALHAQTLTFIHPRTNCEQTLSAPLPDDLREIIYGLENNWVIE